MTYNPLRAALMNLAKTLSENLQSTISSTSTQIQDLNWRNGNLTLGRTLSTEMKTNLLSDLPT